MENPKVSIITTTYNDKENLKKIIAQVKNQDYANIEYVIVDGGSTDGTLEVIAEAAEYFGDRLKWISEKDKGIYDAINKMCIRDRDGQPVINLHRGFQVVIVHPGVFITVDRRVHGALTADG